MTGALIAALLIAWLYPETPTGRWLHRLFVEKPMRLASKLTLRNFVLAALFVLAFQAFAMTLTIVMALIAAIAAIAATAYLEFATAIWSAAALSKARSAWTAMRSFSVAASRRTNAAVQRVSQIIPRTRSRVLRVVRKTLPTLGDEDRRSWARLAYA